MFITLQDFLPDEKFKDQLCKDFNNQIISISFFNVIILKFIKYFEMYFPYEFLITDRLNVLCCSDQDSLY